MRVIYKYPLELGRTHLQLPFEAKVLCVQLQNDNPFIWIEIDPTLYTKVNRVFAVIGTGNNFDGGIYIGTFQMPPYVWHVYEVSS